MGKFNHGDVVYWCEHHGNADYRVNYGIVDEEYHNAVCVSLIEPLETRKINGVPFNDFHDDTFHKLPKGWRYDTKLFDLTYDPLPEGLAHIDLRRPEDVLNALKNGWMVKSETINHGVPHTHITKEGYRVYIDYGTCMGLYDRHRTTVALKKDEVYFSFEEAKSIVDKNIDEFNRQAALSDEEWSIEQIEKSLLRYRLSFGIAEDMIEKCRQYLLSLSDLAEVETRVVANGLQWKYSRNKRWMNVVVH